MSNIKIGDKVKVIFDCYAGDVDNNLGAHRIRLGDIGVVTEIQERSAFNCPISVHFMHREGDVDFNEKELLVLKGDFE